MPTSKLFNTQGRLELLEQVTNEGLLSLEKANIRGNEYFVFKEAPNNLREYYQLGLLHGDWTHIVYQEERFQFNDTLRITSQLALSLIHISEPTRPY